jgi:hypothetical protein
MTDHPDHDPAPTKAEPHTTLANFLAALGGTPDQLHPSDTLNPATACWLTMGGIQVGPVGLEHLEQALEALAEPDQPPPERAAHSHDQKKRA